MLLITGNAEAERVIRGLLEDQAAPHAQPFGVACVAGIAQARAFLAQHDVDVALLDVSQDAVQGTETAVEMGLSALKVPVVLLVAHEDQLTAREAILMGAQDYLVRGHLKPYWLVSALENAIDRHRVLGQLRAYMLDLYASEARFRTIIEHNADGVLIVDEAGRIRFFNRAAEALLGRSHQELEGALWGFPVVPGEAAELDIVRKDGRLTIVEMRMVEIEWEGQRSYLAALRDVNDREQARKALEQTAAQLQRSNEELRLFADVAGHDLREPLRTTSLYLQMLQERYQGQLTLEADHLINAAFDGIVRMRELIDALLAYTRLDGEDTTLQEVDTQALLAKTLAYMQATLEDSGAAVTYDTLPTVKADASQLEQVFQNLLSNAVKFRAQQAPRVHVSARLEDRTWVFSVADNGIGIDKALAPRVFDMFNRLHHREAYPGTGIGLAICKKIITHHGGRIWVESEPGEGATFCFTLPRDGPV